MKTEELQKAIRQMPDKALVILATIPCLVARPSVFADRNGRGGRYYTVRYFAPRSGEALGSQKSIYVGRLADKEVEFIQWWIDLCWAFSSIGGSREKTARDIRCLREDKRKAMKRAAAAAAVCGFYFVGYELRRRRGASEGASEGADGWIELLYALNLAHDLNLPHFLASMDGLLQLLKRPSAVRGPDGQKRLSASVHRLVRSLVHTFRSGEKLNRSLALAERLRETQKAAG